MMKWTFCSHTGSEEDIASFVNGHGLSKVHVHTVVANGPGALGNWVFTVWYWKLSEE